jgi:hypothetical protein
MLRFLCFILAAPSLLPAEGKPSARTHLSIAVLEQTPPLSTGEFKAALDGREARILRALGPKDDLILVLVLDLTGDLALADAARRALLEQVSALPKSQWVAVLKAQDVLQVLADPAADRSTAESAIRDYNPIGKAGFLTTVEEAVALGDALLSRSDVRAAILYVTDSNIYNYREDFTNPVINSSDSRDLSRRFPDQLIREKMRKLADSLSSSETPLFFVHLKYVSDPINEAYQRGLLQLAEESGGAGAFCRSQGDIAPALRRIVEAAATHWSIKIALPSKLPRSGTIDITNGGRGVPSRARFSLGKK